MTVEIAPGPASNGTASGGDGDVCFLRTCGRFLVRLLDSRATRPQHIAGNEQENNAPGHLERRQGDPEDAEDPFADQGKADQHPSHDPAGQSRHLGALLWSVPMRHGQKCRDRGNRIDDHKQRTKGEKGEFEQFNGRERADSHSPAHAQNFDVRPRSRHRCSRRPTHVKSRMPFLCTGGAGIIKRRHSSRQRARSRRDEFAKCRCYDGGVP